MLEETHPTTMEELIRISGLSHGTDVWMPYVPVLEPICSGVTPSASVPEKSEMTSGSVSGIVRASMPVKSMSIRIIVGSSCPRTSSLTNTSCIEPKS